MWLAMDPSTDKGWLCPWTWWLMLGIPVLRRLSKDGQGKPDPHSKFQASLGYRLRQCLKIKKERYSTQCTLLACNWLLEISFSSVKGLVWLEKWFGG